MNCSQWMGYTALGSLPVASMQFYSSNLNELGLWISPFL